MANSKFIGSDLSALLKIEIKKNRLIDTIHETANSFGPKGRWGPNLNDTGVCRLALSDADKGIRDWFVKETSGLGCHLKIDELGNIFATYGGEKDGIPTAIGSHLDTQPLGGRYDGVYGVLSGLEVLRTLKENNISTKYPVCVVNWTNEEGARFPMSTMSSSVWSDKCLKEFVYNMMSVTDEKSVSVKDELERIGYLGKFSCSYTDNPFAAHFEIHIEQGPILEEQNKTIGIVTGAQAYKWIKITLKGKAQHTGTTPLSLRSDSLLATSKLVLKGNELAFKHKGLFSVGILQLSPAVVNVIPEEVLFVIDIRHHEDSALENFLEEYKNEMRKILDVTGKHFEVEMQPVIEQRAVKFDEQCIKCVESAATEVHGQKSCMRMTSGAGHDSCPVSSRCPTSMIFIPSKDGVSHNPEEYSKPEEIEAGFKVLLNAVLKYDSQRI